MVGRVRKGHRGVAPMHQLPQCGVCGKLCYASEKQARRRARMETNADRGEVPLMAYPCSGSWHVGHVPNRARRGKRRR